MHLRVAPEESVSTGEAAGIPPPAPHDLATIRRSRFLARIVVAFSLIAILSVDALLAYLAVEEAREVERSVQRDLQDNARLNTRLIENDLDQVARIFSGINANLLRYLPQQVEGNPEIDAFLEKQLALLPLAGDILVTDAQGAMLFRTGAAPGGGDCPACIAVARNAATDQPPLTGPLVWRNDGRADIIVGQRMNDLFGNFIGAVVLRVNTATLSGALHAVPAPLRATVTVSAADGTILTRAPQHESGTKAGAAVLLAEVASPAFGFTVTAEADRSAALVGWQQNNVLRALAAGAATLTLAGMGFYAIRQIAILDRTFRNLEELRYSLETANATKTNFLANMSHELRTPLNAIIGFADALLSGMFGPLPEPKAPEYLGYIRLSGQHLLDLISDVLDLAKIETGRFDLWVEPTDMAEVCQDCVAMLDPIARPRRIGFTIARRAADTHVTGDKRRLNQVMLNVLSNAVRYNRDGGTVSVEIAAQGRELVITVADTGIGMGAEELRTAFARFGHAPSRVTAEHGGSGLGLPIAKGIVESHGGSMALSSVKDEGTRVEIRLPRRDLRPAGV